MGKQCFILVGIKSDILLTGISYFKCLTDTLLDNMQGVQLINNEVPVDTNIQLHSCYIN
jgi:hypothetical protein